MATNCLEYGITLNNVSGNTEVEKGTGTLTFTESTGERAYNGLGAVPQWGPGAKPLMGGRDE